MSFIDDLFDLLTESHASPKFSDDLDFGDIYDRYDHRPPPPPPPLVPFPPPDPPLLKLEMPKPKTPPSKTPTRPKPNPKKKSTHSSAVTVAPVSASVRTMTSAPRISRSGNNSFRVRHTELISGSILGSTAFTVQKNYYLNPGLADSFPWLAPQAAQWEQYKFHSLGFLYIPIAPTSTQGDLLLIPVYDAQSPTPLTEVQAVNNAGSVTDSCWKSIACRLVPQSMGAGTTRKFVRTGQTAGDLKTFDSGRIFVCSNNETGPSAIGKLFVTYDVEFFIPNSEPQLPSTSLQTFCASLTGGAVVYATGVASNMPAMITLFDPINIGASTNASSTAYYTPPAGTYRFEYQVTMQDNTNESYKIELFCYVGGSEYVVNATSFRSVTQGYLASTNLQMTATLIGCATVTAGQSFAMVIKATGAAGILTAIDSQLILSAC